MSIPQEWHGWKLHRDEFVLVSAKAEIPLTKQQSALMSAFIAAQGKSVHIERLEDAVWPNDADARTRNSIKVQVSKMRTRIRPFLDIQSAGYGSERLKLVDLSVSESLLMEPCS